MTTHDYLQSAAQAMVAAAKSGRPVLPVLKKHSPHIHRQLVLDGKNREILSRWGRSSNVDENAGQGIVPAPILRVIGELAGVPMRGRFVHAGLEHTYGYLFSMIDTPFGRKRDRWVTSDLEKGFGLDPTLLGDQPNKGTLLGNLTWFLACIVFRGQQGFLPCHDIRTVAHEIIAFDYARLQVSRIVERPIWAGSDVSIFTDLVPFPNVIADASKENTLLVYSIQRGARSQPKLITAFPVRSQTVMDLKAAVESPGKVRLRYNAYLRGLFGREVPGRRTLIEPTAQN